MFSPVSPIGDPSGKTDMRRMMTREELDHNASCFQKQMARLISFEGENAAILANNADWLRNLNFLDFMRELRLPRAEPQIWLLPADGWR